MHNFKHIMPTDMDGNVFRTFGEGWMLITAKKPSGSVNTMTASWGGLGYMWNRPVAFVFIRPGRYTMEFVESSDTLTLSFLGEEYRHILRTCGAVSGRDTDKIADCALTIRERDGAVWFDEARRVLVCRKLYSDSIKEEEFIDPAPKIYYKNDEYHRMYICEISDVLERQE